MAAPHATSEYPIEPDDHRRARQLFMLKNLTERGYDLAMQAADNASQQLDDPAPAPDTQDEPAPAAPNVHHMFERYARMVRLFIITEHRIANDAPSAPSRLYRPATPPSDRPDDPRRPMVHEFIHQATRNSPDRANLRREAIAAIDEAIDSDPAFTITAADFLAVVCRQYGLHFDIAKVPDAFIETPTERIPRRAAPSG